MKGIRKYLRSFRERPEELLLVAAVILLYIFAPLIMTRHIESIIMFGLPAGVVIWMMPMLPAGLWLLYYLTRSIRCSLPRSRIHILLTVSGMLALSIMLFILTDSPQIIIREHVLMGAVLQGLVVVIGFAQAIFLFNILSGIFTSRKTVQP